MVKRDGEITELGKNFQSYCKVSFDEEYIPPLYCCKLCKSRLETVMKKTFELMSSFKQSKAQMNRNKRLHSPIRKQTPASKSPAVKKVRIESPKNRAKIPIKRTLIPIKNNEELDIYPLEEKVTLLLNHLPLQFSRETFQVYLSFCVGKRHDSS